MAGATVQVFEHEKVRVGADLRTPAGGTCRFTARHHAALASYADATAERYLVCGRSHVRFTQFVGFLQVGDLGIEILPKADRASCGGHARWHRALVRMLRRIGDLGLEEQDEAALQTEPGRLFDLFLARFLMEVDRIVHEGLGKGYRTIEENRPTFRGRLLVAQHIRRNLVEAARFYVAASVYDYDNLPNRLLHEALRTIEGLPVSVSLRDRAAALRSWFPDLPRWRATALVLDQLRLTRKTARYRTALRLARLIVLDLGADFRKGSAPLLALLFDMNVLWERYVAALARRLGVNASTQQGHVFWRDGDARCALRPDIVLRDPDGRPLLIVDTKWKVPDNDRPSDADLKQMFCYHEVFGCERSMLLYPAPTGPSRTTAVGTFVDRAHRCQRAFLSLDDDPAADLQRLLALGGT